MDQVVSAVFSNFAPPPQDFDFSYDPYRVFPFYVLFLFSLIWSCDVVNLCLGPVV